MDHVASRAIAPFAALYFLLFAALGAEVPFIPQVLAGAGLRPHEVGIVLAAGTIAQVMAAPVFGHVADRLDARLVLFFAALASAASLLSLLVVSHDGLWLALPVYMLFAVATAPLNPLADAITVPACDRLGVPYGRVRGVGSAGFFAGILVSSAIATRLGPQSIVSSAVLFVLLTTTLPLFRSVVKPPPRDGSTTVAGLGTLLRIPVFRRVLLVAALVIGSHAMSDAFAVIHWQASGIASETIGVMLAIAVASEFFVFVFLGPNLLHRLGPSLCIVIGAAVGAARWAVLAESQSIWPVLVTQLLHGLTFSLVHLACMQILSAAVPRQLFATAQSLYSVCSNAIASAAITLAAGALFGALHAHAFWLASILCALAVPVALRMGMAIVPATPPISDSEENA